MQPKISHSSQEASQKPADDQESATLVKKGNLGGVSEPMKQSVLKELEQIPGVGRKIAKDLWGLGLRSVQDLKDKDSEELYLKLCAQKNTQVDRCMLYVLRCSVYYASNKKHNPELLKWWNWKDKKYYPPPQKLIL